MNPEGDAMFALFNLGPAEVLVLLVSGGCFAVCPPRSDAGGQLPAGQEIEGGRRELNAARVARRLSAASKFYKRMFIDP